MGGSVNTDDIILLCWFAPVLFLGRFGARWMIDYIDDEDTFMNGLVGWMLSVMWPILLPGFLLYKLYTITPASAAYLFVARRPRERKKQDKLESLRKRTAELERELDL